ncbi:MAG: hypothetical protein COT46_00195 [Sulfurimonas sp. CG08_land_8_20_14_0_20_36_33]|nr:hypothetical protein [Campylobacterota bacterium]OIO16916.1 MAG: hypothetical protein AUJ81_03225 [Helicobacteraceae bacterium CG1_02_36_14]PIP09372.1 MAG: hypothetical protein COX50_11375 [Sulfurimonas sp. CG23_combo_of_CG06-09_8_20_14_all_36_33]PIS27066.1 MAG: hypothetical protein COT46_00195 [Sulfurimonas sp. CG08_land_8_20_14_0_20_36_33]PIV05783.1 MAG: hypothetical protein COS56_00260 [Sulfurimonas sp. CG03_land_8_20_14_0_80_36_25]PIV61159.1 MAG: hypothetical protein COS13_03500 [Sulfur
MAKSMIRNKLGTKTLTMYVPANNVAAQAFADAVLDGETSVYEGLPAVGSDVVTTARDVNVMIQETATGAKAYLSFIIKATKHEGDVTTALLGKTFNGVIADKVVIIGMRTVTY